MRMRYFALAVAIVVSMFAVTLNGQEAPSRQVTVTCIELPCERFLVTFPKGAMQAITVYQQQVQGEPDDNFPDGRYTPRRVWFLEDSSIEEYEEDWNFIRKYETPWKVWAEIGYIENGEVVYVKSNVIDVVR